MLSNGTTNKSFLEAMNLVSSTGFFELIIPFFIVFAISYAILTKTKILGDNVELNTIISFFVGIVVTLSPISRQMILLMIPMFSVFGVILFLSILLFMLFGVDEKSIVSAVKTPQGYVFLILMALLIFFITVGMVIGSQISDITSGENPSGDMGARIIMIIFDPRVLGTIILMLLFAFAIYFLTNSGEKKD